MDVRKNCMNAKTVVDVHMQRNVRRQIRIEPFDTSRRHFRNYEKRPLVQENCPKRYSFSHLYTTGTKREMRKNSIEFFHIPFFMYEADNRDRTGGLRITSASLYLLSHIGKLYYSIRYKSVCQIKILR